MTSGIGKWCLVLTAFVSLTGCIGHRQYRYFKTDTIPNGQRYLPVLEKTSTYQLAFVEYKDDGKYWDAKQRDHALKLISDVRVVHGRKTVVFLFVHGWHNNADRHLVSKKKDVEKFKDALEYFGRRLQQNGGGSVPRLVGIYVAWRGGSLTPQAVKWATYWPRRGAARTVGTVELPQFLAEVSKAAKDGPEPAKVFFSGHSFGARVLEMAMHEFPRGTKQLQTRSMGEWEQQIATKTQPASEAPVDLVIYLNAATRSTLSRESKRRLEEITVHHPEFDPDKCGGEEGIRNPICREYPLYVAVTSSADAATGILLPAAGVVVPELPLKWHLRSAANTPSLRTHEVVEVECPTKRDQCEEGSTADFCFPTTGDAPGCWEVRRIPEAKGAYWILSVNGGIVRDHGDVWNTNLVALVMNMIQTSGAALPETRPVFVQKVRVQ